MRVAVVGSGVAGISAAYHLRKHGSADLEIVLLEASSEKIGGHANTVKKESMLEAADAGFMVCNHDTYPNLLRWFADLGVPLEPTDMSFCVTDDEDRTWSFGWGVRAWINMLPTKRFWLWVLNMDRFHKEALAALEDDENNDDNDQGEQTILEWLTSRGYHESVVQGWLIPFCQAVWSSPSTAAGSMNAKALFVFLRNHGFLSWRVPHWLTPKNRCGGYYLARAQAWFEANDVKVMLGAKVVASTRLSSVEGGGIELTFEARDLPPERFDKVVFATPAGALTETIADLKPKWRPMLQGFRTHSSEVVVHSDARVMPADKSWWCSWTVAKGGSFTYWLNRLQHQRSEGSRGGQDLFETLNPSLSGITLDEAKVHARFTMTHPVMDKATLKSQEAYFALANRKLVGGAGSKTKNVNSSWDDCGDDNEEEEEEEEDDVFLAGAYLHHGFHEDGFRSGIEACRSVLRDRSVPLLPVPFARIHPVHDKFKGFTRHARLAAPEQEQDDSDGAHSKVAHSFTYPVAYDYVDVSGCPRYWWGGLYREDHFGDPCVELHEEVRRRVCAETGVYPSGDVTLLCSLRAFNYCFNPISLFFVWSESSSESSKGQKEIEFVVSEVSSTPWEQRTVHVLDLRTHNSKRVNTSEGAAAKKKKEKTPCCFVRYKTIHVSPFNPVPDGDQCWEYQLHALPTGPSKGGTAASSSSKVHVTVSLFANEKRLAARQATVIADLNVAKVEVAPGSSSLEERLKTRLAAHAETWWAPWVIMLLPRVVPSCPPLPWSFLNQLRIHWEALRLALKGLRFTPNTSWSAAPQSSAPLFFKPSNSAKASGGMGSCPVYYGGGGGGPGARTAPCFLEHFFLALWALTLLLLVLLDVLRKPVAFAVFAVSSVLGLQVSALVLPPDVTGRRSSV